MATGIRRRRRGVLQGRWAACLLCLVCLLCPAACRPGQAQLTEEQKVAWLGQHAVRLRSIDPADDDFSDLQPLKQVLGEARMVLLGEISHADGGTFLARTRLIRFLHQVMGFDVLAFESGLYDCAKAWELMQAGDDARRAFQGGVFSIWAASEQVQPLVDYLGTGARSDNPLVLVGFDNQFTGSLSSTYLAGDLTAFLQNLGLPAQDRAGWADLVAILDDLTQGAYQAGRKLVPVEAERSRFLETLKVLDADIRSMTDRSDRRAAFWIQVLENTASYARSLWTALDTHNLTTSSQMRDEQMGRNLVWLAEAYYPEHKIVVWAASIHVARNLNRIEVPDPQVQETYRNLEVAGDSVWRELGQEAYVLAATTYAGVGGAPYKSPFDVPPASPGSLEDLLNRSGLELAIVDLRELPPHGGWLRNKQVSRPFGFVEMTADWSRVVDGLLFIREMTPSTAAR